MREVSREWLEFLREQYPKGSRVRLTKMGNDPHPIPPGSMGTLKYIDDVGQFHVKWDNGRGLALIIGEDQFQILPPEPQTIKFYMPLTAQLYAYDDWGDLEEYGNDLDGRELRDYTLYEFSEKSYCDRSVLYSALRPHLLRPDTALQPGGIPEGRNRPGHPADTRW